MCAIAFTNYHTLDLKQNENPDRNNTENSKVSQLNYKSVAFPLIGAGTGGSKKEKFLSLMKTTLNQIDYEGSVVIVKYAKSKT